MKINLQRPGRQPLESVPFGELFVYVGLYYIRLNPHPFIESHHDINHANVWAANLKNGSVHLFDGKTTLVKIVDGELDIR